ncbi:DNA damage-regulated autophagy modulator protein 2 [Elysia marginata]|uniref:DNA damage-regulated autophagy modulator protein 2 n=1 Tax=Elysia marginata TaxID=1093978 RepID=A0AAV4JU08_9GAST|nr:DNA damage-regulated autophagy modulator protein 2 [Elysia marginata]
MKTAPMDNNNTLSICHPVDMQVPLMFQGEGQGKPKPGTQVLHQKEKRKKMMLTTQLRKKLQYLPIITPIFILGTFFLTYCISVSHGHVEFVFPYISYTAVHTPARGIFAQFVNIGAILLAANVYIRYLQMSEVLHRLVATWGYRTTNKASLGVGLISAFGFTMVANFQTVEMRYVHYTGAGLAFLLGVAYLWLQTSMSIRYRRWSPVAISQLVISIITSIFLVICILDLVFSLLITDYYKTCDSLRGVYLTSTFSEWLTAISILVFVFTFVRDFSTLELELPKVRLGDAEQAMREYNQEPQQELEVRKPIFKGNLQASRV